MLLPIKRRKPKPVLGMARWCGLGLGMQVERLKYIIWAVDMARAVRFYHDVFDGEVIRESEVVSELRIAGGIIGIHGGGEGGREGGGVEEGLAGVGAGAGGAGGSTASCVGWECYAGGDGAAAVRELLDPYWGFNAMKDPAALARVLRGRRLADAR
jgi:hypothetical protein